MSVKTALDDTWNRLNHLARRNNLSDKDWIQISLQTGMDALDADLGIISLVQGQTYTVEYCTNRRYTNLTLNLAQMYCDMVITQESLVYLSSRDAELRQHPAYQVIATDEYIGIPLAVDNRIYGTLCFFRVEPRAHKLTRDEAYFVKKSAQMIEKALSEFLVSVA